MSKTVSSYLRELEKEILKDLKRNMLGNTMAGIEAADQFANYKACGGQRSFSSLFTEASR